MEIYERTWEIKLIKSVKLRELMKRDIPKLCEKRNCTCDAINVEYKWYWWNDKYTITVTGEESDLDYIKKQLIYLTQVR